MEDKEKETVAQEQPQQTEKQFSMEDVEQLINKKTAALFGELLKEINKPKEEPKEEPKKEKTLKDYLF